MAYETRNYNVKRPVSSQNPFKNPPLVFGCISFFSFQTEYIIEEFFFLMEYTVLAHIVNQI